MSCEAISNDKSKTDGENVSSYKRKTKTDLFKDNIRSHSPILSKLVKNPSRQYIRKYGKNCPQRMKRSFNKSLINDIPRDRSADNDEISFDIDNIIELLSEFEESSDDESDSDDDGVMRTMFGGDPAPINLNLLGDEKSNSDVDENDSDDKNDPGVDENNPDVDETDSDIDENYPEDIKKVFDNKTFLSECGNIINSPKKINKKLKSYFDELKETCENLFIDYSGKETKSPSDEEFEECCRTLFGNPNDELVNQDKDNIASGSGVSSENDKVPPFVEPDSNCNDFTDSDESDLEFYENTLKKRCHILFDSKEDNKKATDASHVQCDCWFCKQSWIEKFEKEQKRKTYHRQHLCSLESTEIKGEKTIENLLNQHYTSIRKTIEKRGFFHLISCSGSDHKDYNTGLDLDSDQEDCGSDSNLKDSDSDSNLEDTISNQEISDMNPKLYNNYELIDGLILDRNKYELKEGAPIDKDSNSDQEACNLYEAKNCGESSMNPNLYNIDEFLDRLFIDRNKDKLEKDALTDDSNSDQEADRGAWTLDWYDGINFDEFIEEEINEKDTPNKDAPPVHYSKSDQEACSSRDVMDCGESSKKTKRNKWIPKNVEKALHLENCKCKCKHTEDELNEVAMDVNEEEGRAREFQSPSLLHMMFMGKSPLCFSMLKKEHERREKKLF